MWHLVYLILKLNICLAAGPHHLSTGLINPIKTQRVQLLSIIRFLPMQVSQLYPIAMSFIKQASNRGIKPFLKFSSLYILCVSQNHRFSAHFILLNFTFLPRENAHHRYPARALRSFDSRVYTWSFLESQSRASKYIQFIQ